MIMRYADPFDALFAFQQALEERLSSDWLSGGTAGFGGYPPVNLFQQGDDLVATSGLGGRAGVFERGHGGGKALAATGGGRAEEFAPAGVRVIEPGEGAVDQRLEGIVMQSADAQVGRRVGLL